MQCENCGSEEGFEILDNGSDWKEFSCNHCGTVDYEEVSFQDIGYITTRYVPENNTTVCYENIDNEKTVVATLEGNQVEHVGSLRAAIISLQEHSEVLN